MDYPATTRKIEDLPSDGGRTVDTLAGAILRVFVRLNEVDALLGSYGRRLAALEGGIRPQPPRPAPAPQQAAGPPIDPEADPVAHRGRGRPPGSKNKPKTNGFDHDDDRGGLDPERDLAL